jgi:YceI-like domain
MRKYCFCIFILFYFNTNGQTIYRTDSGSIKFRSDASFEIINAFSNKLGGVLDVEKKTFAFSIAISSFDGFNAALQREHFNENYMESDKFKAAIFTGKIIEAVDFSDAGTYQLRAKGVLNIHGINQERIIKCVITIDKEIIKVESSFAVLLNDHGIKIPKVVHEKIASTIEVAVKAELKKQINLPK